MNIIVGITGASGAIYGVRLLEELHKNKDISTHVIVSHWGKKTLKLETEYELSYVRKLADLFYEEDDLTAPVASGSFITEGMVIAPCSMKTLAAIAAGFSNNLIVRTADISLKEKKKLVLLPRETPLNAIHLENMLKLARLGAIIAPPVPAYYSSPQNIEQIIDHSVGRVLDQFNIEHDLIVRWEGEN